MNSLPIAQLGCYFFATRQGVQKCTTKFLLIFNQAGKKERRKNLNYQKIIINKKKIQLKGSCYDH